MIRAELERLGAEEAARSGCRGVYTPVLAKRELYERSGHWSKFAADMFPVMDVGGEEYVLRPANCPHHAMAYAAQPHSFRDLPVRFSEQGAMFRSELSGVLSGLSRVRQINLDDAHVFCTPDQAGAEVVAALESIRRCYGVLGIEVHRYRQSLRGPGDGYLGTDAQWQHAEAQLAAALDRIGLAYEPVVGEAAFYGPKIDVQVLDAAGREETLSTVQLDFSQPKRFGLEYTGSDGRRHQPLMIHRGVLGSMERLVALLLELNQAGCRCGSRRCRCRCWPSRRRSAAMLTTWSPPWSTSACGRRATWTARWARGSGWPVSVAPATSPCSARRRSRPQLWTCSTRSPASVRLGCRKRSSPTSPPRSRLATLGSREGEDAGSTARSATPHGSPARTTENSPW